MMRYALLYTILMYCSLVTAQNTTHGKTLSIGYFGQYLIQPGFKIGTKFNIKSNHKASDEEVKKRISSFFLGPQIGYFARAENNYNFLLNADIGWQSNKRNSNAYLSLSMGLGLLLQSNINSFSINLSNGDTEEVSRSSQIYFTPTVSFEHGLHINKNIGWYYKLSIGEKISGSKGNTMAGFTELGINLKL